MALLCCLILAQALRAQTGTEGSLRPQHLAYFAADSSKTLQQVIQVYRAGGFKPLKMVILNVGVPDQLYWIHFTLANPNSRIDSLVIDLDNARLNKMELFEVEGADAQSLGKLGDFYPFSQRNFLNKNFLYQTRLSGRQKKEFFLLVDQIGHTFVLPVKIYTTKNFSSAVFRDYLFDGVTYGILLFVALVSLLFFLTSRYRLYLYYSFYIITAICWFLGYFGLGYQYIWGSYPYLNTLMAPLMASVNVLLNLQICQFLLQLRTSNRVLNRIANLAKILLAACALFPIACNLHRYGYALNHAYMIIFLCTVLLAMGTVSLSVIRNALQGSLAARFYFAASLLKALSIIDLALLELGLLPAVPNMEGWMQLGIFVEITLLTYALANRYSIFKLRTFERVIQAHERERSLISQEIHDCISNSLTGMKYSLTDLIAQNGYPLSLRDRLQRILDELNTVQKEARNISHNTMPDYVQEGSMVEIVEKFVEETQEKCGPTPAGAGIRIGFSANGSRIRFSEPVKLNIFRITQELITNILKHSKATQADLLLTFGKKELTLVAEDNGIGYKAASGNRQTGMGLKNIRSRVELLDGNLSILSPLFKREPEESSGLPALPAEGYGTSIRIRIPYENNQLHHKNGYDY